ncbi:dTDP-4-amino-4,6-dideoxygalactose transaminase [Caulobacter ginsengisoli]|uniref:dTDP-4-amino-4,6-dideoxygalactose transaminase n=1 Tax=Caulobacter ginsengisoli TaxID=400775 RepID=A0ABU0IRL2_9CAUL|nr:DegT/DnrJ/EryC1/StrS family aminotransferase [Caulobacter ginsengisoli]MDQ0464614.1 dTDP-4-amino-4,6-dideoxygalactose transaminase [Caulobacter ginsengisoli]
MTQSLRPTPESAPETAPRRLPVARPWAPPAEAILPYLHEADANRWYSNFGPLLTRFEERLADRFAAPTNIATCANATQAITLTLKALGVQPGLCLMPAWTFVATAHAAMAAGLTPHFLDVDPQTQVPSPADVRAAIAKGGVSAVIVVAPYGAPLEHRPWEALMDATGVPVLIDAAAAFDTVTRASLPTLVSLHATKLLGVGEGGYLACEDADLVARVRAQTSFGFQGSRESLVPATNAKLSEYAAAVGLAALDGWPSARLRYAITAQKIRLALALVPEINFQPGWGTHWVSTTCIVRIDGGGAPLLEASLAESGVDTRRWWGGGCQASPAFAGCPSDPLPVTTKLARETLGLPFAADMDEDDIDWLACAVIQAVRG